MLYADYNFVHSVYNNLFYTVDMLRLNTKFTFRDFDRLLARIRPFGLIKKEYHSTSITEFRENFVIEYSENSSFWFGFIHNSEFFKGGASLQNDSKTFNFTIEFNPNKVPIKSVLKIILASTTNWTIKSLDLAVDIPINILDLCGFDKGRKKDIRVFSQGLDNKTIYIGRSNNRIKIYNKKIESNLEKELTRVEVTSKLDLDIKDIIYFNYDINFPDLYLNEYLYTFKDYEDKTLMAVLFAVQSGFNINDLSRRYKDKVKNLLNGGYKINIDNKLCTKAIKNCISNLFYFIEY